MPSAGSTPVEQAFSELHYAESRDRVNVKVCYQSHQHHLGLLHIKADDLAKPDFFSAHCVPLNHDCKVTQEKLPERVGPRTAWLKDPAQQVVTNSTMIVVRALTRTEPFSLRRKLSIFTMPLPGRKKANPQNLPCHLHPAFWSAAWQAAMLAQEHLPPCVLPGLNFLFSFLPHM